MGQGDYLGEFEALVLTAVVRSGERANGAAVYREISVRAARDVSLPSVHVTLRRLEEKGLVTSIVASPSSRGGRPRRYYQATAQGIRAVQVFRDTWRKVWRGLQLPDPDGQP